MQFVSLPKTLMSLAANGVEDDNKKELLKMKFWALGVISELKEQNDKE